MTFSSGDDLGRGPRTARGLMWLVAAIGAGLAGCGKSDRLPVLQVYDVKGKVLLADGKPLSGGRIYFVPKGDLPITPNGLIGTDGTFSLVTGGSGEGAPAGEYKVRIEARESGPMVRSRNRDSRPDTTMRIARVSSITVRAESNQLEPILLK